MKILFVCEESYPPLDSGGFAQLCHDVGQGLTARGHTVIVLTLADPYGRQVQDVELVTRKLHPPIQFTNNKIPVPIQQIFLAPLRKSKNLLIFNKLIKENNFDIIMFWPNFYGDPHMMLAAQSRNDIKVCYYVAGISPQRNMVEQYWRFPGKNKIIKIIKSILKPFFMMDNRRLPSFLPKNIMSVSEFERQRMIHEGISPGNIVVVYNGIDETQFPFLGLPSFRRQMHQPLRLLYAGRLDYTKGVHTAVEALKEIKDHKPGVEVQLGILGEGPKEYMVDLHRLVKKYDLFRDVTFFPWLPRQQVPKFMKEYDVLILPTIHDEPLARVVQEAMAIGLGVIATSTGGTIEIVHHEETGLLFKPENSAELAQLICRFYNDSSLMDIVVSNSYQLVKRKFTMKRMIDEVEDYLYQWTGLQRISG